MMRKAEIVPAWLLLGTGIAIALNLLGTVTTGITIELMRSVSEFALEVREHDLRLLVPYRCVAFPAVTGLLIAYLWPIIAHFRRGTDAPAPEVVRRRTVNAPLVIALLGFAPWLLSATFFPLMTLYMYGRWSVDLMSQQVLSPLVNGFLVATTTYLMEDWLFRAMVIPRIFPDGHLSNVPGSLILGVRARLLVFLVAVAFTPLFTMLGLVRAAAVRIEAGGAVGDVISKLSRASEAAFAVYVLVGIGLALLLARTLTRPLAAAAAALRRIESGEVNVRLRTSSGDEVGVLEDGVNTMAAALGEKERILQTFGRVVEPAVRDVLLAGNLRLGGEMRQASILFCDLRGFTGLAEQTAPAEVVSTLNEFFSAMAGWVRDCGGHVDKFVGDAMLVVFGLFANGSATDARDAAQAALRCGVGMHTALAALNERRVAAGRPRLAMSIGIHSGEVLAGTIGAQHRHEYTVIGDAVNVAARLQSLCAERGHRLLASENAHRLAAEQSGFGLLPLEPVRLRGRSAPVGVFGLP
jgi:adenylate cyclase